MTTRRLDPTPLGHRHSAADVSPETSWIADGHVPDARALARAVRRPR